MTEQPPQKESLLIPIYVFRYAQQYFTADTKAISALRSQILQTHGYLGFQILGKLEKGRQEYLENISKEQSES